MTQTAMGIEARPLPVGWKWVKLGDVCDITAKLVDPTTNQYINHLHVNGENIESGSGQIGEAFPVGELGMKSGKYLFSKGEVLYSKLRPYLKKVTVAEFDGVCSADMYPIAAKPNVLDAYWLRWLLLSSSFTEYAIEQSARSRMPKLNRNQLMIWKFALPPLEEQKRIAAILNEQMAAVEKAKKAAEERLEAAKALPAAYLREVFPSDEDALPEEWEWVELTDVATLEDGDRGTNYPSRSEYQDSGIPFINASQIDDGTVNLQGMNYITAAKSKLLRKGRIQPFDILFALRGSVGKFASVQDMSEGVIGSNLIIIRCGDSITHNFMEAYLGSAICKNMIQSFTTGSAQPNMSSNNLAKFQIPLPPPEQQNRITQSINDKLSGVQKAEESIRQELETIEAMPAALLRKAFSGDL